MKQVWLIEELYSSEDCRYQFRFFTKRRCLFDRTKFFGAECKKETCPLKVGGSNDNT